MVENLYNNLAKFEGLYRFKPYSVHKKLSFGRESDIKDLDDWLGKYVHLNKNSIILDAGCGNGNSLFKLIEKYSCKGIGISLSEVEIRKANSYAIKKKLVQNCQFMVHNFERSLPQKVDLIYAIESIKHSKNIDNVIRNFANQLGPKSTLIIVEDLKKKEISNKEYLTFHERTWVSSTFSENDIIEKAFDHNLELIDSIDFTDYVSKSTIVKINFKINRLKLLRKTIPFKNFRNIIDVFIAGFMLDHCYASDEMAYKALIFKKLN